MAKGSSLERSPLVLHVVHVASEDRQQFAEVMRVAVTPENAWRVKGQPSLVV